MESTLPTFPTFVAKSQERRRWNMAELSRRSGISAPELSRVMSGTRQPTLRIVRGLACAFAAAPKTSGYEPHSYPGWFARLGDLAEEGRILARQEKEQAKYQTARPASGEQVVEHDDATPTGISLVEE